MNIHPPFVQLRKKAGGNLNTLLYIAIKMKDVCLVEATLKAGANANIQNRYTWTALHEAAAINFTKGIDLLLQNKADVNCKTKEKYTPLHIAAMYGRYEAAKALLEAGVGLEDKDYHNRTALDIAEDNGRRAIVQLLREYEEK